MASYQTQGLRGINFQWNRLDFWNFSDQRLTDADFRNASFDTTSFAGADLRGANFEGVDRDVNSGGSPLLTVHTIEPDGHIDGLSFPDFGFPSHLRRMTAKIRDYEGDIGITIDRLFSSIEESTIEVYFEDADWGSTMTLNLDPGELAELDGTLWLGFIAGTDEAALVGTTFQVFDWNGFLPSGESFADVAWPTGYAWDISDLYDGGTVTLLSIPEPATMVLLALAALAIRRR